MIAQRYSKIQNFLLLFLALLYSAPALANSTRVYRVGSELVQVIHERKGGISQLKVIYGNYGRWTYLGPGYYSPWHFVHSFPTEEKLLEREKFELVLNSNSYEGLSLIVSLDKPVAIVIGQEILEFLQDNFGKMRESCDQARSSIGSPAAIHDLESALDYQDKFSCGTVLNASRMGTLFSFFDSKKNGKYILSQYAAIRKLLQEGHDLPAPKPRANLLQELDWGTFQAQKTQLSPYIIDISGVLLLVTHPERIFYDKGLTFWKNVGKVTAKWKEQSRPIAYLLNDDGFSDATLGLNVVPDFYYFSHSGEHLFRSCSGHIVIAGGFFLECHLNSILRSIELFFSCDQRHRSRELNITVPMDAVYFKDRASTVSQVFELAKNRESFLKKPMVALTAGKNPMEYLFRTYLDGKLISVWGSGDKIVNVRNQTKSFASGILSEDLSD